ncbi:MAG TPA: alanine--glyoxylate aminotransferase family protein [Candidatus Polarisedimenticolaceae bacterium]|nr:alanine--glyoxylate aminotransferase family protein [Candidatus Polarisedimenticolaceae bacterium]
MFHKRLFIPGPTEVRVENLAALAKPQIGHRSDEFKQLYRSVVPKLRRLLRTEGKVFLFSCSSTGVWEAAIRNCVADRVLCCMQGAFSDRWQKVAEANGKNSRELRVDWGRAIRAEMVDEALSGGGFDAVTLVHNETSTGVMNHLDEIAEVMRNHPDVLFLVDAVSSMAGAPIDVDAYGIDVCLAGLQKAFSLPAGLTVASVSERALERARRVTNRGYYFDFLEMLKYDEREQTPSTPAIPQIHALDAQLDAILAEGPDRRFERHAMLAGIVRDWARDRFALFAEEGYESPTVSCMRNTREISVAALNQELGLQYAAISNGYGVLKEKTFRIAHMGDTQEWEIRGLLATIDRIVGRRA